ncbi:flagellar hook-associated protein FlgL [Endozoicomonas arenosclerae]|uniref:flagellar hook-associated protein FlgL n=1 Tax=Endozoicomonas arenosclerae TaxID=1633495 RepID=UPI000782700B|nr:flagellar hook-associated protein FlgL [Endozoicomonas arenosclerae]
MRISTLQFSNMMLQNMQRNNSELAITSNQLGTGKKLSVPSDDPISAVKLLHIDQELAAISQYKGNINALKRGLSEEETVLNSMNNILQRVREIVVSAGNSTYGDGERNALALELDEQIKALKGLANYQQADGQYIFSGTDALTQPLQSSGPGYVYAGNDQQRQININSSTTVAANDTARDLFFNVSLNSTTNSGAVNVDRYTISNLETFGDFASVTLVYNGTDLDVTYTDHAGNTTVDSTTPWTPGTSITLNGGTVELDAVPAGAFNITLTPEDTFTELEQLSAALKSPGGPSELSSWLHSVDNTMSKVGKVQTSIGGRMNALENGSESLDDLKLLNDILKSELEDLDYVEAISRLNRQQVVLQAGQQSYSMIQGLTLFNYIR